MTHRDPVFVHCADCGHEWAPCVAPIELTLMAKALKQAATLPCFMCGSTKPQLLGETAKPTDEGEAHEWLRNGDTGLSSLTIWRVLMGETPERPRTPSDPSDFGRCYRLLKVMPAWRARLPEVAVKYPEWTSLVDGWDDLTAIYEEELPSGRAPRTWQRMRELRGER